LFLDEIGDMPLELQAKLLRALQEKEVQPVGGQPVPVDIRVAAATNADLLKRIEDGRFRRDLYYRLAAHVVEVPPLRRRREDVPLLVGALLRRFAREEGRSLRGVTAGALRALVEQDWPGNVRELEHVVRRLVQLCPEGDAIDTALVALQAPPSSKESSGPETSLDLASRLQALEGQLVREALARARGNRTQAARLLGVSRNGLAIKMQRLGIDAGS
jgi:transcriptional regulator with PAS, ATPase and Fis domain